MMTMFTAKPRTADTKWPSWEVLKKQLKTVFKEHTVAQKAHKKLKNLCQGKHSIDSFFSLFETLAVECSLTKHKQLIYLLEKAVSKKIITQIVTAQDPPTNYEAYKAIILCVSHYHKKWDDQLCHQGHHHLFNIQSTTKPTNKPVWISSLRQTHWYWYHLQRSQQSNGHQHNLTTELLLQLWRNQSLQIQLSPPIETEVQHASTGSGSDR